MAITDHIRVWYEFDDNTDSHGAGPNFTQVNSPTYIAARVGNGVDTDTTNQSYLSVANASAGIFQAGTVSFSYVIWVYFNNLPTGSTNIIRFGAINAATAGWHCIASSTGEVFFRLSTGTTLYSASTGASAITAGAWYHVSCTIDRNGFMRGYINGVQRAAVSIAAASASDIQSSENFLIGGNFNQFSDAVFDEFMIWDGRMSADVRSIHRNGSTGINYTDFAAITRPFVAQEFIHEQESNATNATTPVRGLVAGQIVVAMLVTDGNTTGPAVDAWDGAWTLAIDGGTPNGGSQLVRTRVYWKTVTATDVSTETEVRITWATSEKAVLISQLWENSVGLHVANESDTAAAATVYTENGVTTTVNGCRVVMGIGIDGGTVVNSVSPAIPFNEYQVTNSAGHVGLWLGSEDKATAGATGTYTITLAASVAAVPFTFAMEPLPSGITVDASAADGMTLADTAAGSIAALVSASDGIVLSDAAAVTLGRLAAALDGVTLTDAATVSLVLSAAAADGLSLSDVAAVITLFHVAAADGMRFSDSASVSIVIQASASDGWAFSDGATFPTGAAYAAATLSIANAIAATLSLQNAISATLNIKPD